MDERTFKHLKAVHSWLVEQGWKISQAGIYKHKAEGKITPDMPDGSFTQKRVEKYAKDWLRRKDTGEKVRDELERYQKRKAIAETRRAEAQAKKLEHELAVAQGKYIPRDDFFAELAARALALESGLKGMVQARALAWVDLVGGDASRAPELVASISGDIDRFLGEFASVGQFLVVIERPQEAA